MTRASELGDLFVAWGAAAGVALVQMDSDGSVVFLTDESQTATGLKIGDQLSLAVGPSDVSRIDLEIEQLSSRGEAIDTTAWLRCAEKVARLVVRRTVDSLGDTSAMICAFCDISAEDQDRQRLESLLDRDGLTGLLTRAAILRDLEAGYRSTPISAHGATAVLFVDLDDFKGTNDGYGHLTGDKVLQVIAHRLDHVVGDIHKVARMGGDEFLIVLGGPTSESQAVALARVVAEALEAPVVVNDFSIEQRFSIGVAVDALGPTVDDFTDSAQPTARVERLLGEADMAMYVAKNSGVSVALADDSTRLWSTRRLVIERDLRDALQHDEIEFHYQPVVDLEHGKWVAAEALLRWDHPELGMLPPELVVERAEVIGCSDELARYTSDRVAREWAELVRRAPVMFHHQATINASARQLSWAGFVDAHLGAIKRVGLTPEHLVIEVTESSRIELHRAASRTLNRLADHGVRVILDDFGVGYSALSYFTQFPIQGIKIDRSLVAELRGDGSVAETLLRGVARIANDLGTRLVGEGVETAEAAQHCRDVGMATGQGWYFGRPMPFEDLCALAPEHGLPRTGDKVVLPTDPQITGLPAIVDLRPTGPIRR